MSLKLVVVQRWLPLTTRAATQREPQLNRTPQLKHFNVGRCCAHHRSSVQIGQCFRSKVFISSPNRLSASSVPQLRRGPFVESVVPQEAYEPRLSHDVPGFHRLSKSALCPPTRFLKNRAFASRYIQLLSQLTDHRTAGIGNTPNAPLLSSRCPMLPKTKRARFLSER